MAEAEPLAPLLAALEDLAGWLERSGIRGMVIGGVAASLLGRPRVTRDIDAMVFLGEEEPDRLLDAAAQSGFTPRIKDCLAFARVSRVLLLRHEASGIDVDVVLGALPFEKQAAARTTLVNVGGVQLPLVSPEDLIIMKAVAHRPRDLADIEGILAARRDIDRRRVLHWVTEFAAVLETPEILTDLKHLLSEHRSRRP